MTSSPTAPFGPLQRFVDDPACQEVRISRCDRVFVRRAGHLTHASEVSFPSDVELRRFVEQLSGWSTATIRNLVHPLPGEMLMVAHFPPESPNVTVDLFKPGTRPERWDDLIATNALPAEAAEYLSAAVREGTSVLIVGPPESGKATLLNVLAGTLPASERVAVIDEARRLTSVRANARVTVASGPEQDRPEEVLVAEALRRSPKWVVLASALLEDATTLLAAVVRGHARVLVTVPVSHEYHASGLVEDLALRLHKPDEFSFEDQQRLLGYLAPLVVLTATDRPKQRSWHVHAIVGLAPQADLPEVVELWTWDLTASRLVPTGRRFEAVRPTEPFVPVSSPTQPAPIQEPSVDVLG